MSRKSKSPAVPQSDRKKRIIFILRIVMPLVGLTTFLVLAPLDLIWTWLLPLPDTVQEELDPANGRGLDGIIIYAQQGDNEPGFFAAGLKNKETGEPADPHALFKIASIHKLYVATAVAKLVAEQRLSLDDKLADHLPELAGRIENAEEITLQMMVQHRSGIPNFTDSESFDWFVPQTDSSKHLELILDQPADFRPDARYRYSNTNYLLLGRVMDSVLGYSHQNYIDEAILAPLGLSNTFHSIEDVEFDRVMSGYWYQYDDDFRYLGGSMIATAEDVGIFLKALNDGSLLTEDEQAIYSSIYKYEHTGWVPGYYSIARYHSDDDMVAIMFVSTTGGERSGLANIVYGRVVRILRKQ